MLGGVIHSDTCRNLRKGKGPLTKNQDRMNLWDFSLKRSRGMEGKKAWPSTCWRSVTYLVAQSGSENLRAVEITTNGFWSLLQGNRQVIFLTLQLAMQNYLLISGKPHHFTPRWLPCFHAPWHSIKREWVIYHHQSVQHKYVLRIQYLSPNSHMYQKKKKKMKRF